MSLMDMNIFPELVSVLWDGFWPAMRELLQNTFDHCQVYNLTTGRRHENIHLETSCITSANGEQTLVYEFRKEGKVIVKITSAENEVTIEQSNTEEFDRAMLLPGGTGKDDRPECAGKYGDGLKSAIASMMAQRGKVGFRFLNKSESVEWGFKESHRGHIHLERTTTARKNTDCQEPMMIITVKWKGVGEFFPRGVVPRFRVFADDPTTTGVANSSSSPIKSTIFQGEVQGEYLIIHQTVMEGAEEGFQNQTEKGSIYVHGIHVESTSERLNIGNDYSISINFNSSAHVANEDKSQIAEETISFNQIILKNFLDFSKKNNSCNEDQVKELLNSCIFGNKDGTKSWLVKNPELLREFVDKYEDSISKEGDLLFCSEDDFRQIMAFRSNLFSKWAVEHLVKKKILIVTPITVFEEKITSEQLRLAVINSLEWKQQSKTSEMIAQLIECFTSNLTVKVYICSSSKLKHCFAYRVNTNDVSYYISDTSSSLYYLRTVLALKYRGSRNHILTKNRRILNLELVQEAIAVKHHNNLMQISFSYEELKKIHDSVTHKIIQCSSPQQDSMELDAKNDDETISPDDDGEYNNDPKEIYEVFQTQSSLEGQEEEIDSHEDDNFMEKKIVVGYFKDVFQNLLEHANFPICLRFKPGNPPSSREGNTIVLNMAVLADDALIPNAYDVWEQLIKQLALGRVSPECSTAQYLAKVDQCLIEQEHLRDDIDSASVNKKKVSNIQQVKQKNTLREGKNQWAVVKGLLLKEQQQAVVIDFFHNLFHSWYEKYPILLFQLKKWVTNLKTLQLCSMVRGIYDYFISIPRKECNIDRFSFQWDEILDANPPLEPRFKNQLPKNQDQDEQFDSEWVAKVVQQQQMEVEIGAPFKKRKVE